MVKHLNVIPEHFYRYRSLKTQDQLDRELKAIEENYVWCSTYRDMNDPMEGTYNPSQLLLLRKEFQVFEENVFQRKS
jgi:hypothetical protein